MSAHVLLDNVLLPADAARIPASCEGFAYGHGVFETIKLISGRPAFLARHHARLLASARELDLPYAVPLDTLRERIARVAAANALSDGSAKVTLFNAGDTTGELVSTRANPYPTDTYTRGFALRTVFFGDRTGSLSGHKTLNYLANIRAKRAALSAGFDEPLFLTPAGLVIEGATTNLFAVRSGVARTPSLASGPLPGIARAQVLELLGPARARESLLTRDELLHADELFVTNALLGVMPVTRLDDRSFPAGPFTQALRADYAVRETASLL